MNLASICQSYLLGANCLNNSISRERFNDERFRIGIHIFYALNMYKIKILLLQIK